MMSSDFSLVADYLAEQAKAYTYFVTRVTTLLTENPELSHSGMPCVHSIKVRQKSRKSIIDKCERKKVKGRLVSPENAADEIEDFFGVRVLHIHLDQLPIIHEFLQKQEARGEFVFNEKPKAYTWDPEFESTLSGLGLEVNFKDSLYTSVHYVLRNVDSPVRFELQIRTLFEETWGELDHWMNYPRPTEVKALREQLLVLSRVVTAGSRLAVSIHRLNTDSI